MNNLRKTLYGLLVVAIMLNLVLPPTLVQAYDGLPNALFNTGDRNATSVTDLTYGKDPNNGQDPSSVTKVTLRGNYRQYSYFRVYNGCEGE